MMFTLLYVVHLWLSVGTSVGVVMGAYCDVVYLSGVSYGV